MHMRKGGQNSDKSQVAERPAPPKPYAHVRTDRICGVSEHGDVVFATDGQVQTYELPFAFGAKVHIDGHKDIRATVTGFAVYPHNSEVRAEWFANGDAKSAWFGVDRLTAAE